MQTLFVDCKPNIASETEHIKLCDKENTGKDA